MFLGWAATCARIRNVDFASLIYCNGSWLLGFEPLRGPLPNLSKSTFLTHVAVLPCTSYPQNMCKISQIFNSSVKSASIREGCSQEGGAQEKYAEGDIS